MKRLLMILAMVVMAATSLLAQERAERSEVVVYYRHDKFTLDHHYMTNPEAFATLDSIFHNHAHAIDSIDIVAYASPEGRSSYNQWLSSKRARSMKGFLTVKYPKVDFSNLTTHALGEDFEGLIRMIEADKNVPYQKQVLKVLRQTNKSTDKRMKELYKLRGGTPYRYIRKHILPWLRTATTCIIYYNPAALEAEEVIGRIVEQPIGTQLSGVGAGSILTSLSMANYLATSQWPEPTEEQLREAEEPEEQAEQEGRRYLVAAKTNLLFDMIGALNVEAELPIGNRYSIDASWTFPWYLDREWDWCYQLLWGDIEGRYWLGERSRDNRLLGHFVGLYAGGGLYDFQLRSADGYQGEFFLAAGVSYGYSMKIGNRWRMEFEFGLGYLQSQYRHYFHITEPDGTEKLIRDRVSGKFGYWGPTKAKVSLVLPLEWGSGKSRRADSLGD